MHDANDVNDKPKTPGRENVSSKETTRQNQTPETQKSPLKSIRAKCLDCCCGQKEEVKLCPVHDCPLYPYRLGKHPGIKRVMSEEQRKAASERMKALRSRAKTSQN